MCLDLQLLRAGDDAEWNKAFDKYDLWEKAKTEVDALLGGITPQHVEDVAEQALVELVHKAIHRCHTEGMIVPMVRRIARDRAIDFRRRFWAQLVEHPDQDLFDPADEQLERFRRRMEHVQERLQMDGDLNAILNNFVVAAQLNVLEEALLREHVIEGFTQQEFADRHGIALGNIGRIKASLIRKIRRFIDGH